MANKVTRPVIKAPRWFKIFITQNKRPGARQAMLDAVIAGQKNDGKRFVRRDNDEDA